MKSAKKILREFKYPEKAIDYNKLPNAVDFWASKIENISAKAGLKNIPEFQSIADMILWLNYAAKAWQEGAVKEEIGETKMNTSAKWNEVYNKYYKDYVQVLDSKAPEVNIEKWEDPGVYPSGAGGAPLPSKYYADSIEGGIIKVKILPGVAAEIGTNDPKALDEWLSDFATDFAATEWGINYVLSWDIKVSGDTAVITIKDFDDEKMDLNMQQDASDDKLFSESLRKKINALVLKEFVHMSKKVVKKGKKSELGKFRKMIKEELDKIYKTKVTKESPITKVQREENKDDKFELNAQANAQDKKTGSSKPTDKEWKEMRTAKEVDLVPSFEQYNEYISELWNDLEKDLPKIQEECKKFGDRELDGLVGKAMDLYTERNTRFVGEKKHIMYTEMKGVLAPIGHRIVSLESFLKEKSSKGDSAAVKKLILKYLKKQDPIKPKKETEK